MTPKEIYEKVMKTEPLTPKKVKIYNPCFNCKVLTEMTTNERMLYSRIGHKDCQNCKKWGESND